MLQLHHGGVLTTTSSTSNNSNNKKSNSNNDDNNAGSNEFNKNNIHGNVVIQQQQQQLQQQPLQHLQQQQRRQYLTNTIEVAIEEATFVENTNLTSGGSSSLSSSSVSSASSTSSFNKHISATTSTTLTTTPTAIKLEQQQPHNNDGILERETSTTIKVENIKDEQEDELEPQQQQQLETPPSPSHHPTANNNNNNLIQQNTNGNSSIIGMEVSATPPENALGHLKYDQELLYITEMNTVIGRNSSTSLVHFHVAENNLVSRKHFQLIYNNDTQDFFVQCLSKNGIFVDDYLQRRNAEPLKLPQSCYFRFPSTEIRINFENYFVGTGPLTLVGVTSGNVRTVGMNRRHNSNPHNINNNNHHHHHNNQVGTLIHHNNSNNNNNNNNQNNNNNNNITRNSNTSNGIDVHDGGSGNISIAGNGNGIGDSITQAAASSGITDEEQQQENYAHLQQQHHYHHNNNNNNSTIKKNNKTNNITNNNSQQQTFHSNSQYHQNHVEQHNIQQQQYQNIYNIQQPPQQQTQYQQQQQLGSFNSGSSGGVGVAITSGNTDAINNAYTPLKITIPKKEQKSPYLSPTGTISAANSCPASPRQGFHQNQPNNYNYNNNLQNQDLFQTPSTATYNHNEKPPYSYAQLIVQAISAAPDKQLTLSGIYSFIVKHYPYYRKETNKGWQNSIRHNLSLNRYFIKVARSQDEPGKGSFWRIDPDSGAKLIDHSYKKRRQRSSQGFRPSYGMPRSAPVSPSHMDNSRESSPLQDIVLQSAPGSPGMSLENRNNDNELMYSSQAAIDANNAHNQFNNVGNSYYEQQQQGNVNGTSNTNGVNNFGTIITMKRNHTIANALQLQQQHHHQQQQYHQQQPLHPDIIYEELPTDISGAIESGDDGECEPAVVTIATQQQHHHHHHQQQQHITHHVASGVNAGPGTNIAAKRPKYISEVL